VEVWLHTFLASSSVGDEWSEVLTAVKTEVAFFWVVMPCSVVLGYRRFGGSYRAHLQGEMNGDRKTTQQNEQLHLSNHLLLACNAV
jgi:hypothetical protein